MATTDEIVASFNLFAAAVAADQNAQDARITASGTSLNDVLLYRTGNVVTGLTVGANLSVSGGVLNASGGMGGGDVNGPATNTADYVPQWDGANSKLLKNGRAIGATNAGDLIDRAAGDARYRLQSVAITKADVGLGNVDNTSDLAKPISTATQTALDGKQPLDGDLTALAALTGTNTIYYRSAANTWTAVTIGTGLTFTGGTLAATGGGGGSGDVVGPASATNNGVALFDGTTGKLLKDGPLLSTYALLASPTFTGTPAAPTASPGTNTTQLATTAFVTAAVTDAKPIQAIAIAISDETTAITTGTAKATFRMPYAFTLTAVRASLTTASSSGLPTFDINENGTTILSTKITIDVSEKTSTTAATPPVISDASLADDAEITIDIDVAGTGAAGAKIYLIGRRA